MAEAATPDAAGRPVDAGMAALGEGFRGASDAKLRKVTRLIDSMPQRGAADALLAPVRDRLATLRPVRTMNRNRLLFTPFDRVLVPDARWQPGAFCLPRSVLAPVIALLDAPGRPVPSVPPFDAGDPAELLRCGRPLWDSAAAALEGAAPGGAAPGGMAAGPDNALAELLPAMALVFRFAHAMRTLPSQRGPVLDAALSGMLNAAARCNPVAWGIMLTLLFDVAPADLVARLAATVGRGERTAALLRAGMDHAVTEMLGRLERTARLPTDPPPDAPAFLLDRLAAMQRLAGLRSVENRPGFEQKRISRLEQAMDAANREMFQKSLQAQLEQFEQAVSNRTGSGADALSAIEADARRLRSFALGAAALAGGRDYEAMIEDMTDRLRDGGGGAAGGGAAGGGAVARLRLVELLAGSERAMQMAAAFVGGAP